MVSSPFYDNLITTDPVPVLCILGPTGAGKTAASIGIAQRCDGVIINIDSRQLYTDFPIITAQPTREEQQLVPHFLYGFLPTWQSLSAGQYARMATQCILEQHALKKTPILVGGTGLFIRTLFSGIAPIPDIPDEIRQFWQNELQASGAPALHKILAAIDPEYAQKIHPNDRQRITRALEVNEATGKTFTWWHQQPVPPSPFQPVYIGIKRSLADLTPLLDQRITAMIQAGALSEARDAYSRCQDQHAPGWSGIGCAEIYSHITGQCSLEETLTLWLKNTRAYAKRQLTWFNGQKDITWFSPDSPETIISFALDKLTPVSPLPHN